MSLFESAKELARKGFYVFPVVPNGKTPCLKEYTECSTNSPEDLGRFWVESVLGLHHQYNIGIATSHYDGGGLLVVDVDNKEGKNGSQTLIGLELEGKVLPKTRTQRTPTGGLHYIYKVKTPVKQSVGLFGKTSGIDTRSKGGYIVGAGSSIDGKFYQMDDHPIVDAPEWLLIKCNETASIARKVKNKNKISQKGAKIKARDYLLNHAQIAIEGSSGDQTTFATASKLKDLGLTEENCLELMLDNWNENCQPPWGVNELTIKVSNAYQYGMNDVGVDSPESDFKTIVEPEDVGPIEKINGEFSFIVLGGRSTIIRRFDSSEIDYMSVQAFHDLLKAQTIQTGNGKKKNISMAWMESNKRSTFNKVELIPGKQAPSGVYNLWQGYDIEPLGKDDIPTNEMIEGVRLFKEHALNNVCDGDVNLCHWLIGYFAGLIQRPWEKPLTALVFKGKKGVGKNALIQRIGNLLTRHYLLASNRRYFMSNFNKHLASLILLVLDEAFWSGDKSAEGMLKDLITGDRHLIEHKGREVFSVKNFVRVVIIGNEDWVIPATEDERRFAVFNVGDKQRQDKSFFKRMRVLLEEKGGNRLLMRELMQFDLDSVDLDDAPQTEGLLDQKVASLNLIHSWWLSCLKEGTILSLDLVEDWPVAISRQALREAFLTYSKARGVKSWLPDSSTFGKEISKVCREIKSRRLGGRHSRQYSYLIPKLEDSQKQFEEFIGHKISWDTGKIIPDADYFFS